MGVAATGKTTLSREIARRVSAVYLDNNYIADAFFPRTRNGPEYDRLRPKLYRALYTIAEENLKLGNTVLLDVPHVKDVQKKQWRTFITRLARKTGAKMIVVRCLCSERTLYRRIRSRGEPRDRWKTDHWKEFLKNEPIDIRIPFKHLDINTENALSKNLRDALSYILKESSITGRNVARLRRNKKKKMFTKTQSTQSSEIWF